MSTLAPDSRPLERMLFGRAALPEDLRAQDGASAPRDRLREVVRIQDEAFLRRLESLGLTPDACLALALAPLVLVAWADGTIHERERQALLEAARRQGVGGGRRAAAALEGALSRAPNPRLFDLWSAYVRRLWGCFTADERWRMRENVLGTARGVATAAGRLLGLTSGISAAERACLDRIQAVLDQG